MSKYKIGVLTFPITNSGTKPLSNLIDILAPIADNLFLVTGGMGYETFKTDQRLKVCGIKNEIKNNVIGRVWEYFYIQIKISYQMLKMRKLNTCIFFIGGDTLVLPMLIAKLSRKKVFLFFAGSSIKTLESSGDNFYKIAKILSLINCELSDKIILYSETNNEWELNNYKNKITIANGHFLDFEEFKISREFGERKNLIGYIGRLSKRKRS